jgi:hypothetical protein
MGMGMVGREQKNYNSFFKNNFPQQLKRKVCGRNVLGFNNKVQNRLYFGWF